jgi:zinc protease
MRSKKNIQGAIVGFCLLALLFGAAYSQKAPRDKFTFGPLNPIKMPKVERAELPNGIKLFLVEDPEYPTIDVWAMVRTGSIFEPAAKAGLASITGTVLRTGGTKSKT